jgi:hypothetical protein
MLTLIFLGRYLKRNHLGNTVMTPPLSMYFKEGNVTHISLIGQLHHRSSKDNPKATIRILKTSASDKQFSFT